MTGFLGSVLFVFGAMFAYAAVVSDAGGLAAVSAVCVALGIWMCKRSGVF